LLILYKKKEPPETHKYTKGDVQKACEKTTTWHGWG